MKTIKFIQLFFHIFIFIFFQEKLSLQKVQYFFEIKKLKEYVEYKSKTSFVKSYNKKKEN